MPPPKHLPKHLGSLDVAHTGERRGEIVTTNPPGAGLAFSLFIHRQRHPAFKKFSQSHPLRIIDTRRSQFQLYTTVLRERLKIPPLTARMSGAVVDLVCSDQLSRGLRAWQARLRHPAGRLLGDCDLLRSTSASRMRRERVMADVRARSCWGIRQERTAQYGGRMFVFAATLGVQ